MSTITFSQSDVSRLKKFMESDRTKSVSLAQGMIHICVSSITGLFRVTVADGNMSYMAINCDDVEYIDNLCSLYMWRDDKVVSAIYGTRA